MNRRLNTSLDIVVLGLSITSSWGNGHATTYRGLVRELARRGHHILFLERDVPWYADNRDLPKPPYCRTELYESLEDLRDRFTAAVRDADFVLVGSYVPDGIAVGDWALNTAHGSVAFYDIDTPVTLAALARGDCQYLAPEQISRYGAYFSFTGGPTLRLLENRLGSPMARPLYCSFDPELYYPEERAVQWDLGYMGTYSADRQPPLRIMMLDAAVLHPKGRFVVAGPQYPDKIVWPENVERIQHLAPSEHRAFYNSQRFTLNVTRADMVRAGHSPSVRLFEAAACGVPVISDYWKGLGDLFRIGAEILVSRGPEDTLMFLRNITDEGRHAIGERARLRVLAEHTAAHRAAELETHISELLARQSPLLAATPRRPAA